MNDTIMYFICAKIIRLFRLLMILKSMSWNCPS